MSFFADGAEPDAGEQVSLEQTELEPEPAPWSGPPEGEVPAVLPVSALLGVTEQVAVVLASVRVFSTGVELSVEVRARRANLSEDDWEDLMDRVRGFGRRGRRRLAGRLRVGVGLDDGTKVVDDDAPPTSVEHTDLPARLVAIGGSGTGSGRIWVSSWTYWLWPLPADGSLTVVTQWTQLGLDESTTTIDGRNLSAIARQARRIWPDKGPLHVGRQPSWIIAF